MLAKFIYFSLFHFEIKTCFTKGDEQTVNGRGQNYEMLLLGSFNILVPWWLDDFGGKAKTKSRDDTDLKAFL